VKPFEREPLLIDMAPTILAALGAPASVKHTGCVLHEVVGAEAHVQAGAAAGTVAAEAEPTVSDTEADEMEEHLRGLGYLE
jgi:arylsulfatase A-like enzyme